MNEPLVERIEQLQRSVKRWRLVSLCLAFVLVCVLAIGIVFTASPPTQQPGNFWLFLPWVRARVAREEALRAEQEARALQAADAARRAVDAVKRAKDDAAKQP